jgi:hypothetical protein
LGSRGNNDDETVILTCDASFFCTFVPLLNLRSAILCEKVLTRLTTPLVASTRRRTSKIAATLSLHSETCPFLARPLLHARCLSHCVFRIVPFSSSSFPFSFGCLRFMVTRSISPLRRVMRRGTYKLRQSRSRDHEAVPQGVLPFFGRTVGVFLL